MCNIDDEEKLKGLPIMLKENALDFSKDYQDACGKFEDELKLLRDWNSSNERRARIPTEWQNLRLSIEMAKSPDKSKETIFRYFVAKLVALQKQLDSKYECDGFLIVQLLISVEIPDIQTSLKDRIPENAQEAIHRISNRLCDKPKTAGATSTSITTYVSDDDATQEIYSLDKHLGGEGKRKPKF